MRIRKYMIIGVLGIVVFPWIVYFVIHMIDIHPWQRPKNSPEVNLTQTIKMISQNESKWTKPNWQHYLGAKLKKENLQAVIHFPSNQVIYSTFNSAHHHWMSNQQVMVVQNGKWIGTIELFKPGQADPAAVIGAILGAIFAFSFVSFQIGRNVIKPLESMNRAALQIAEGDLDFAITSSNAIEIKQVRTAFQVMVNGLRDAFAKQRKLEDERKFFIGAIAHDLRTPLFSLRGYLDGIKQGVATSPEKIDHYVTVCQEKAAHLDRLVSDLFSFTRLEYLEQTLQKESFNLANLVNSTVSSMRQKAQEKKITMDTTMFDDCCRITGDPHLLERAITNLLDNAIRYTPHKGKMTIDLQNESRKIVLKIEDCGPGFSNEDVERIFEPMYRGDPSRNLITGGAGLGLTIARRIFRSHGGDLSAENSSAGGALLVGWIPSE